MSALGARARRLLATVALTLPATGALLAVGAPSASAAVTAPGNGTVFTSYASVEIVAEHGPSGEGTTLSLAAPGSGPVTVASAPADRFNGGSLRYRLDLGCWTFPSSDCRGGALAPNGTWTVTQSGGTSGSSTFTTRIAPQAPSGVAAEAAGAREVRVRWDLGPEPDLAGYAVYEGSALVKDGIGLGSCDGGLCSTTISYAGDGGGTHTYAVRALRSDGSGSTLESPQSSTASATLDAAPASPPAGDGGSDGGTDGGSDSGGSAGGGTGGTGGGGSTGGGGTGGSGGPSAAPGSPSSGPTTAPAPGAPGEPAPGTPAGGDVPTSGSSANPDQVAVAQRKAFATGFTAFGPKLGIPKLPPLPQTPSPEVAPELADGGFAPTLGFEDQVVTERVEVAGSTSRVRGVVGSALDSEQLARSTAGALLLLLAGAHLRRWLGAATPE